MSPYDMVILRNGIRQELWLSQLEVVASFINANALKPVDARHLGAGAPGLSLGAVAGAAGHQVGTPTAQIVLPWDPRPWGGWPIAHLHYAGEMYLLNKSQWGEFSRKVMAGFAEKLRTTEKVTFNQLMDVSAAVAEL
jgi:hypothetical protein